MPKRKRRRKLRIEVWLWAGILLNVGFGIANSPITSITRLRVLGVQNYDRQRVEEYAKGLTDEPALRDDPRQFETNILNASEVDSVDFRRNVFGRAELKIKYRVPVAGIEGRTALDDQGMLYRTRQDLSGLPTVVLPPSSSSMMLASTLPTGEIAKFLMKLPSFLKGADTVVSLSPKGAICLNRSGIARIQFGSERDLDEKLQVLQAKLETNPDLLTKSKEVNLVSPKYPSATPMGSTESKPI
ncbi:MAG: hypothetical protein JSS72_11895 [Armatimonadetes bacterium]|nr:hypothetical protein [Armatimonadota bacterium]